MSKWSGLEMNIGYLSDMDQADQYLDELKARGFTTIRVSLRDYANATELANSKLVVAKVVSRGMNAIWGISSNPTKITSTTLAAYHAAVLSAATWAQANGVYEFQIGNEEEWHTTYEVFSPNVVRLNNVVTVTTSVPHLFNGTRQVEINSSWRSEINGLKDITVTGANTFTFTQAGENMSDTYIQCRDVALADLRTELRTIATEAQAIFTRGNVTYSVANDYAAAWITDGKGDLDLLGLNVYLSNTTYKTTITNLITAFTASGCYITEFNAHVTALASYSTNEDKLAAGIGGLLDYIQDAGYTRAAFFKYEDANHGCKPTLNGDFHLFWNNLTTNNGRRWFI